MRHLVPVSTLNSLPPPPCVGGVGVTNLSSRNSSSLLRALLHTHASLRQCAMCPSHAHLTKCATGVLGEALGKRRVGDHAQHLQVHAGVLRLHRRRRGLRGCDWWALPLRGDARSLLAAPLEFHHRHRRRGRHVAEGAPGTLYSCGYTAVVLVIRLWLYGYGYTAVACCTVRCLTTLWLVICHLDTHSSRTRHDTSTRDTSTRDTSTRDIISPLPAAGDAPTGGD